MKLKMTFAILALAMTTSAAALNAEDRARKVKDYLQKTVFEIKGVNGIGISGCNSRTGELQIDDNSVPCVMIYAESAQTQRKLIGLYPPGTQIRGVFIAIKFVGKIRPQPRMSVGG